MTFQAFAFAIPGDINTQSGGYSYDRELLAGLRAQGRRVDHIALGGSYPDPTSEDAIDAARLLAGVPGDCPIIIDGLALGAMDTGALSAMAAPVVALIHHPLAYEGNPDAERREYLVQNERENLRLAAHVVVTSPHTAGLLTSVYDVPANRITVAQPGIDRVVSTGQRVDPPLIVSVGLQIPRKGHDVLLLALAQIIDLPWNAVIAGPVVDEDYAATLVTLRDNLGLGTRVRLAGRVSDEAVKKLYGQASVFALATRFEGYGMVFGEAMAHGLPVVTCATGAVPDTVAPGAGLLVEPDNPDMFATALASVLSDDTLRGELALASRSAGAALATWPETAKRVGAVLDGLWPSRSEERNSVPGESPGE